ncbi:hypothetical protein TRFO_08508 [Tritrichomonas foetus]|uniref:Uncharacterized protein n=1 Tax=Tritrichomonas foetus TaxID=1144522 RepID=A0A1J4JJC1_9EUKA|nr:hypothetical protein TRFO_08508 [Tritrichomonas foetus]|eukprot:OHS99258.1 hypothetical protein TRFO_08508 [Tritrichomonas foetus]
MYNLTILKLISSSFLLSPCFSIPHYNYLNDLLFHNIRFSNSFRGFFDSSNQNINKLSFSGSHFSHLLDNAIHYTKMSAIKEFFYVYQSFNKEENEVNILFCTFYKINNNKEHGGAVFITLTQKIIFLISNAFIDCHCFNDKGKGGGCYIDPEENCLTKLKSNCFFLCTSTASGQALHFSSDYGDKIEMNETNVNQCGPLNSIVTQSNVVDIWGVTIVSHLNSTKNTAYQSSGLIVIVPQNKEISSIVFISFLNNTAPKLPLYELIYHNGDNIGTIELDRWNIIGTKRETIIAPLAVYTNFQCYHKNTAFIKNYGNITINAKIGEVTFQKCIFDITPVDSENVIWSSDSQEGQRTIKISALYLKQCYETYSKGNDKQKSKIIKIVVSVVFSIIGFILLIIGLYFLYLLYKKYQSAHDSGYFKDNQTLLGNVPVLQI